MTGSEQVRRWSVYKAPSDCVPRERGPKGEFLPNHAGLVDGECTAGEWVPVVSLSDLQREIAELRRGTPDHTRYVGWHGALDLLVERLGIDLEEGKD